MPAMHLGYADNGQVTEKLINFYAERSRGGAGLIVVGGCGIDEHGYGNMIRVDDDKFLPGLKKLVAAVHEGGAAIAAQLFQPGRYSYSFLYGIQPVAPSPVPSKLTGKTPRELTGGEIRGIISSFARAAVRVKEAGFDAVEVIGSAGYLISQFLSPLTNQRDDEYGGDRERRMRFGLEVASAIRAAVGRDFPLIFRVSGHEYMPGGNTNEEMAEFCRRLEKEGVDAINVTGGWHETRVPQITMEVPRGTYTYVARGIKEVVSIPVIACNRISDPRLAEEILLDGLADMVGIARGFIADPELPQKAREDRLDEIRKCIGCNQGCLDAVFTLKPVRCLVNAKAGREGEKPMQPAGKVKKILVIGGGPAGMEFARVAACKGHDVTLWEGGERLGGQLNLASVPPGRGEFKSLISYLEKQLQLNKVKVELNKAATAQKIKAFEADVVVVATGGAPLVPPIPGVEKACVVQAWDVLAGKVATGRKVVIIGGGAVGCETGLYLARRGTINAEQFYFLAAHQAEPLEKLLELASRGIKDITILEMQKRIGADIGVSTRWIILQEMRRLGVKTLTGAKAKEITDSYVVIDRGTGAEEKIEADTVVLAAGSRSVNSLYKELKEELPEVYLIGDAFKPAKALDAIHQGYELALTI